MIKIITKDRIKHFLNKNFKFLLSNFKPVFGGLTKIPSKNTSTISDLFLWRKDNSWSTYFELLDIKHLINPNNDFSKDSAVKLIFFDNLGEIIFEKEITYSKSGRKSINISEILPHTFNGYGTFSCFHLINNTFLTESKSFYTERGYCGYSRNNNLSRSYVHGNLDAIAFDKSNIEMLGNYNKRTYFYNLQYEFLPGFNYDIVLTNPTEKSQNISLLFDNNNKLNEVFKINPRGSLVKHIFIDKKIKLVIKSNIYMARPVIFRYHDDSLDVFHG